MPPGTKKTSISLDPDLEARAKERAAERGFNYSFSAYVASLIREDLRQAEPTRLNEPPAKYAVPGRSKLPPGKTGISKRKMN